MEVEIIIKPPAPPIINNNNFEKKLKKLKKLNNKQNKVENNNQNLVIVYKQKCISRLCIVIIYILGTLLLIGFLLGFINIIIHYFKNK